MTAKRFFEKGHKISSNSNIFVFQFSSAPCGLDFNAMNYVDLEKEGASHEDSDVSRVFYYR